MVRPNPTQPRGAAEKLEDVLVVPKPDHDRIILHLANGEISNKYVPEHSLFRVTVAGQEYAFDLAAAQYGRFRTVTPWDEYVADLCLGVKAVFPFGDCARDMQRGRRERFE